MGNELKLKIDLISTTDDVVKTELKRVIEIAKAMNEQVLVNLCTGYMYVTPNSCVEDLCNIWVLTLENRKQNHEIKNLQAEIIQLNKPKQ